MEEEDYLDSLEMTRMRAPFSSRRRWLSFLRCSSCWKEMEKVRIVSRDTDRGVKTKDKMCDYMCVERESNETFLH